MCYDLPTGAGGHGTAWTGQSGQTRCGAGFGSAGPCAARAAPPSISEACTRLKWPSPPPPAPVCPCTEILKDGRQPIKGGDDINDNDRAFCHKWLPPRGVVSSR